MHLRFLSFLHTDRSQVIEILLFLCTTRTYLFYIVDIMGAARSQGISNHDIDLVKLR